MLNNLPGVTELKFWDSELNLSRSTICTGTAKHTGESGEEPKLMTSMCAAGTIKVGCTCHTDKTGSSWWCTGRRDMTLLGFSCWWCARQRGHDPLGLLGRAWECGDWNVRNQNLDQGSGKNRSTLMISVERSNGTWWQWGQGLQFGQRSEKWGRDTHPSERE